MCCTLSSATLLLPWGTASPTRYSNTYAAWLPTRYSNINKVQLHLRDDQSFILTRILYIHWLDYWKSLHVHWYRFYPLVACLHVIFQNTFWRYFCGVGVDGRSVYIENTPPPWQGCINWKYATPPPWQGCIYWKYATHPPPAPPCMQENICLLHLEEKIDKGEETREKMLKKM